MSQAPHGDAGAGSPAPPPADAVTDLDVMLLDGYNALAAIEQLREVDPAALGPDDVALTAVVVGVPVRLDPSALAFATPAELVARACEVSVLALHDVALRLASHFADRRAEAVQAEIGDQLGVHPEGMSHAAPPS